MHLTELARLVLIVVAVSTLLAPREAKAQYTADTVGASLEPYYRKLLASCGAAIVDRRVSAIPENLRELNGMKLQDPVLTVLEGTVAPDNVFTHVFKGDNVWELKDKANLTPDSQVVTLQVGALPFRDAQPRPGTTSIYRADTCGSALNAAATVSGGLGLPFFAAHVEGAVRSQATRQFRLFVLLGDFVSPLYYQLTDSRLAFGTRMRIWEHYHANAGARMATHINP